MNEMTNKYINDFPDNDFYKIVNNFLIKKSYREKGLNI